MRARAASPTDRPAFYALAPGGWRDLVTVLHPPYTAWNLSLRRDRRGGRAAPVRRAAARTLAAFLLGVGVVRARARRAQRPPARHRPFERHAGRRWRRSSLAGAVAIGVVGAVTISLTLVPFVCAGAFIVLAYNLEWFGGRFHTDFWFAASWGAFPALTGYWVNALELRVARCRGGRRCFAMTSPSGASAPRCASCAGAPSRSKASSAWRRHGRGARRGAPRRAARGRAQRLRAGDGAARHGLGAGAAVMVLFASGLGAGAAVMVLFASGLGAGAAVMVLFASGLGAGAAVR